MTPLRPWVLVEILLLTASLGSGGCAAILGDGVSDIRVESRPPGADVSIDGQAAGKAPLALQLQSSRPRLLEIKMGQESKAIYLDTHVQWYWVVLDIPLWIISIPVDASTGAWYELEPTTVVAEFSTAQASPWQADPGAPTPGSIAPAPATPATSPPPTPSPALPEPQ